MTDGTILRNFDKIIKIIGDKSPLQKKRINKYISKKDKSFFDEFEVFAASYIGYLESQEISLESAIDSYLQLCYDMMTARLYFMKIGKYPEEGSNGFVNGLYKNEVEMKSYMIGLAISQFLWSTHYEMYRCLKTHLRRNKDDIHSYLEIGPGHGLFFNMAMDYLGKNTHFYAIDISPISIEITKSIIAYFRPKSTGVRYNIIDFLDLNVGEKFDFITMGEVLEHVNYPEKLLIKLKDLLALKGKAFVSTCVN
ncbi:methyltransferase domain-containing protein, partial [Candidatus Omnitrophota bacterium]